MTNLEVVKAFQARHLRRMSAVGTRFAAGSRSRCLLCLEHARLYASRPPWHSDRWEAAAWPTDDRDVGRAESSPAEPADLAQTVPSA